MYAIYNQRKKKFLFGTDFRRYNLKYDTYSQRISANQMLTFDTLDSAISNFRTRKCGKDYVIVVLKTIEINRIVDERKYR